MSMRALTGANRVVPADPGRGAIVLLAAGRAALVLASIVSIKASTSMLGAHEMGVMHLVIGAATFCGLLMSGFGHYFYRRVAEWQIEGVLRSNLVRYATCMAVGAALAGLGAALLHAGGGAWQAMPGAVLAALVAGQVFVAALLGALLHMLNLRSRRGRYALLANTAAWGGIGLAALAVQAIGPRAEVWLAGLLLAQALCAVCAGVYSGLFARGPRVRGPAPARAVEAFTLRSSLAFAWPLLLCSALYGVQRTAHLPWLAERAGAEALGLFAVAFSLGMLAMLSLDTLLAEVFRPAHDRAIAHAGESARAQAWQVYAAACLPALVAAFVLVCAAAAPLLELLTERAFHGGARYVAWGAAAQLWISVHGLSLVRASSALDNRVLLLPNLAGALTTLALLRWPPLDDALLGAALAVNAGLLLAAVGAGVATSRLFAAKWPWARTAGAAALALPALGLGRLDSGLAVDAPPALHSAMVLAGVALWALVLLLAHACGASGPARRPGEAAR